MNEKKCSPDSSTELVPFLKYKMIQIKKQKKRQKKLSKTSD